MKTSFLTVVSVLSAIVASTSAFATGENTVTSKSYVDAQDATKQNTIPATGTNASTPGSTVVTYTKTAGTIGERGIYDGSYEYGSGVDDATKLITAGAVQGQIDASVTNVNNQITNINNQLNGQTLEPITVQLPLTCANSCEGLTGKDKSVCEMGAGAPGGCTLWTIGNVGVAHKLYNCTTATVATDCPACGTGTVKACENNICTCNACKGLGVVASNASECCSGARANDTGVCCSDSSVEYACPTK